MGPELFVQQTHDEPIAIAAITLSTIGKKLIILTSISFPYLDACELTESL